MSKKDYIAIAKVIAAQREQVETSFNGGAITGPSYEGKMETLRRTAYGLADVCAAVNSAFDRNRFIAACGF